MMAREMIQSIFRWHASQGGTRTSLSEKSFDEERREKRPSNNRRRYILYGVRRRLWLPYPFLNGRHRKNKTLARGPPYPIQGIEKMDAKGEQKV